MESSIDAIRIQIKKAEPVLKVLDARMESIVFDPLSPSSVDAANAEIAQVFKELLAPSSANPILGPLAAELQSQYLENVQSQVSDAKML